MMLNFNDNSSRQPEQNSFPADTVSWSSGNSLDLWDALSVWDHDFPHLDNASFLWGGGVNF